MDKAAEFTKKLLEWYHPADRPLPWKHQKDPYRIWLSEIILQQTRVEQGLPYYERFIDTYPTVESLASADLDSIYKLWEGLGYYSRARNLHHAAIQVVEVFGGQFPKTYKELLLLKGVGNYTAAAIASFAFGLPHAVVDGNVFRVLSRVFGMDTPTDSSSGKKAFESLANSLISKNQPAIYNQAIMDFGATVCKPRGPLCEDCIFRHNCEALHAERIDELPVKAKKLIKKRRYFTFLLIKEDQKLWIHKREQGDIWANLYSYPVLETMHGFDEKNIKQQLNVESQFRLRVISTQKQVLTHQIIEAQFLLLDKKEIQFNLQSHLLVELHELEAYGFPKILKAFHKSEDFLKI